MNFFKQQFSLVEEAKKTGKGHKLWLEILIFIAVFFSGTAVEGAVTVVFMIVRLFLSPTFFSAVFSDDPASLVELLSDPEGLFPDGTILFSLYLTLAATAVYLLYCRFLEKRNLRSVGFQQKHALIHYGKGLLIGLLLFSAVVLLGMLFGGFRFIGISPDFSPIMLIFFFFGFVFQGMNEEVLCRGYFMISSARKNSVIAAVLTNSLLFALLHSLNSGLSTLAVINLFLFGFFASVYMLKSGNIWGVAAIHSIWNFAQGNLFGLSVSGMQGMPSVFVFEQTGKPLLDGGAFGPEGGLPVTIVLLTAILCVLFISPKKETAPPLSL